MKSGKCGICKTPLSSIRVKKRKADGKIVYDFLYYCKGCDKIPKHEV